MTSSAVAGESAAPSKLAAAIQPMIDAHRGVVAIKIKYLKTGETFEHQANRVLPSASMIKLPIMVAAYEAAATGRISLDDRIVLKESDKVPGSGILTPHFSAGAEITLRDATRLMMSWSDNTATNLVIDAIGIRATNQLLDRLGYSRIRLNSKVFLRSASIAPERSKKYGLGQMPPDETVALLERLVAGDPFGAGLGQGYGKADAKRVAEMVKEMMEHLRSCQHHNMTNRFLPEDVVVAHKGGSVSSSRCDSGIIESPVGPIVYCIMTTDNEDKSWSDENEASLLGAEIGRAMYQYFVEPGGVAPPRVARVLRMGDSGDLVEALQRTINRRLGLKEEAKLGVDGDFGPNTAGGVKRFQQSVGLKPTGEVDSETWKALGALVMEDDPEPAPAEVNSTLLPRKPQDPLDGPPITTCIAWAIADGKTGKLLWGENEGLIRDPASTTKIMTAYVVVSLAEKDPTVLDEIITFSERADQTSGSTAGVRVGERVSARELLYGLMLPSGNGASVAFAEHFGGRLPSTEKGEADTAFDRFVAEMNAQAAKVGMTNTGYRNTHGLTAEGHVTTAEDLIKLAHAAMQNEVFRKVVATRRHGVTLDSVDGYQRNVVWKNTDGMLEYEGFYGVKTGTTGPAGSCLVSAGERDGRPLYVVVLGATSGDARDSDARNLYRWAWSQEEKEEEMRRGSV